MIKNLTFLLSVFLFLGCNHPESKTYERNQKSTYNSPATETESQHNSVYSLNEEIESTPTPPTYKTNNRNVLQMEVQNGVRYVWIEINGIKLKFIFDTGASSICISSAEAVVLFRQGLLQEEDIIGTQSFQDATGRISEGTKINLREVKIGDIVLENIEATVIDNVNAPLLLGQSVLERFGSIEIDNYNNEIIFK
ncbi:retroviral-like aspartic protease family protein [Empedobacter falsenii]